LRNRAPKGALQPLLYQTFKRFTRALFAAANLSVLQGGLFLRAAMHMLDFYGDHVALKHNLHIGNRHAIGKQSQILIGVGVQRNHRTTAHSQQLVHGHMRVAKANSKIDIDDVKGRHKYAPSDKDVRAGVRMQSNAPHHCCAEFKVNK
tara:strand:- start:929 stop:1372 length:444 start_codon:yes stop_codon:yes gene_type:complete